MMDFKLPSLGADMDQGKLLEWKVKPGDAVKRGQVIALVDTSKAAVDVEVWHDGVVEELITKPGETIPVGTVMAKLSGAGEAAAAPPSAPAPAPGQKPAPVKAVPPTLRKPASPAARKRAHELDLDIEQVIGTGAHGAVTLEDVEKAAKPAKPAAAAKAPAPAAGIDRQLEMRKAIGAAMSRSKREIPHYYLAETIPMHRALEHLARANESRPVTERVLIGALQLKAVALTLRRFPDLNGFWQDGALRAGAGIHVGVAISLRQGGLVAPAIHDVDQLGLEDLMRALADLVKRARAGSLRSSEMSDPTITVTNLGEQGVDSVFGVIYPPQVALVGFGRIAERALAEDGALRVAPVVTATLSGDHRASDGHRGARFLAALREQLQRPEEL
jgi:pyruvate dehydrogenase E2 component (dihydrolipoamide acetyltransferase)